MIEIRLAQSVNQKLETDIRQVMGEVNAEESGITMKLYKRAKLTDDYLIIIITQRSIREFNSRGLGQRLKAAFREYGLVNHTVWNEISNNTQSEL